MKRIWHSGVKSFRSIPVHKGLWAVALFLLILGHISDPIPRVAAAGPQSGDIAVWELGNGRAIDGYIKAEYLRIVNGTIYIAYEEYDLIGDLEITFANKTAGLLWRNHTYLIELFDSGDYPRENRTLAGIEFDCLKIATTIGGISLDFYYDMNTGVLVESLKGDGAFQKLISWGDIDVKAYTEGKNIAGFQWWAGAAMIAVGLALKKSNFKRKRS